MEHFIEFAEVTGAILASMGLAMWMEWYCLRWLMRLMPGTSVAAQVNGAAKLRAGENTAEEADEGAKAA